MSHAGFDSNLNAQRVQVVGQAAAATGTPVKNEDDGHVSGDSGSFVLGVRNDALAARTSANADYSPISVDAAGAQFVNPAVFTYNAVIAADAQIKGAAGVLHSITFSCNDAAPTAGSIIVYDSLTETGTQIFNHTFTTTPFVPFTVTFDCVFATGLYVGFTTTNDVNVSVSYK